MSEKGVTIERSPSGLGMGMFSTHLGGGGTNWDQQQNTIITKITPTPTTTRINTNTDNHENQRRRRKSGEKNNMGRSCGCGGWIRAGQLEHDLAELRTTHNSLLAGLHAQVEALKQKNRDLTFQLLMGPYAGGMKAEVPLSPESDDAISPKNDVPSKVDNNKPRKESTSTTSATSAAPASSTSSTSNHVANKENRVEKEEPKLEKLSEEMTNGDVTVVRRKLRGRSGRGDPRLVRSLDLELLEEEANHTRILLEEEKAKNKYLTTLVEDLKR